MSNETQTPSFVGPRGVLHPPFDLPGRNSTTTPQTEATSISTTSLSPSPQASPFKFSSTTSTSTISSPTSSSLRTAVLITLTATDTPFISDGGTTVTVPFTVSVDVPLASQTQTSRSASSPSKSFFQNTAAVVGVFALAGLIGVAIVTFAFLKVFRHRRFMNFGGDGARKGQFQGRWGQRITPFPGLAGALGDQSPEGRIIVSDPPPAQLEREAHLNGQVVMESPESLPSYTESLPPYRADISTASEVAVSEALATAPSNSLGARGDVADLKDFLRT